MAHDILDDIRTRVEARTATAGGGTIKIDPATWLAILSSVLEVVLECLKKKNDRKQVADSLRRPMVGQQLVVRRKLIKELGRTQFKQLGPEIVQNLVAVAHDATPEEAELFVEQLTNA